VSVDRSEAGGVNPRDGCSESYLISLDHIRGQIGESWISGLLNAVELISLASEFDVMIQKGCFEAKFVGLHHKGLKEAGKRHHCN